MMNKTILFQNIVGLPFCTLVEDFNTKYQEISTSNLLEEDKNLYLNNKMAFKTQWAKCFIMSHFTTEEGIDTWYILSSF